MTPEQIQALDATLRAKIEALDDSDREMAHIEADELLVGVLKELGFHQACAAWEALGKWYS
jgi:hypothetical protein